MAFQIGSNFRLKSQLPLDEKSVVVDIAARNALVINNEAYNGLIVYVISDNTYYSYNGTSWTPLNLTGGGGGSANLNFTYVNSATTVSKNTRIGADTLNNSFTITLPISNLNVGDVIEIIDLNKTFHLNPLVIAGAPTVIESSSAGLTCNVQGANFNLIWVGGQIGWEISIIDNNFSTAGVIESTDSTVIPLLYLAVEGSNECFDTPNSRNFKIPWNKIVWINNVHSSTGVNIDPTKIITYNPINKNIYFRNSGIYNIDLRYGSFNLIDSNDFLRARLRSSNIPITGGLASNPTAPVEQRVPEGDVAPGALVLSSFAQGPIGTSFNGEAMQAGFTTFEITGATYVVTDYLHAGALNTNNNQPLGFPVNNNNFGNQPFMFLTKIL